MVYNQIQGAEGYGLETQTRYLFTQADRVDLGLTLEKTRVGDATNPWSNPSSIVSGFQTCTGTDSLDIPQPYGCHPVITADSPLPHSPTVNGDIAYQHVFTLPSGAALTAHADMHFQSSAWGVIEEYPDVYEPAYEETDLSLIYNPSDNKYQVSAWVRNLENRALVAGGSVSSSGKSEAVCQATTPATVLSCGGTPAFIDLEPPRTFGVTVTAKF